MTTNDGVLFHLRRMRLVNEYVCTMKEGGREGVREGLCEGERVNYK